MFRVKVKRKRWRGSTSVCPLGALRVAVICLKLMTLKSKTSRLLEISSAGVFSCFFLYGLYTDHIENTASNSFYIRFWKVLTTVYETQNCWVVRLCPSSGVLETRKHSQWLRLTLSTGSNWVRIFPPHLRNETDPISEALCFLVSRIPDDGQSPKTQ
jgi:hypothetical protein